MLKILPDRTIDFDGLAGVDLHVSALGSELFPDQPVAVLRVDDHALARLELALRFLVALVVPILKVKQRQMILFEALDCLSCSRWARSTLRGFCRLILATNFPKNNLVMRKSKLRAAGSQSK